MIILQTSLGTIKIELDKVNAPETSRNFLQYAEEGFYNNTIFHRVISGFMIQGGGFESNLYPKMTHPAIFNEADNNLKNLRGTLAMARTGEPHSATSQFFINLNDNDFLNHTAKTPQGWGYCVFGRVVEGMDIVDKIAAIKTIPRAGHENVPIDDAVIKKVIIDESDDS